MRLIHNNSNEFKKELETKLMHNQCQIYSLVGFLQKKKKIVNDQNKGFYKINLKQIFRN